MTDALFRQDAYLATCDAVITGIEEDGSILLDRTIFYPTGGGQMGDFGFLELEDGQRLVVSTTLKDRDSGAIKHVIESKGNNTSEGGNSSARVGDKVVCHIDWAKRYCHMRLHTALHLLSVVVPYAVTGGQISAHEARLDFNIPSPDFTKDSLTEALQDLIDADHAVSMCWISEEELDAQPDLVKTMSVQPPRGNGTVRLVAIGDVDLQPCGGTHVQSTAEIGQVFVSKIENKGKQNRRIRIQFGVDNI